MKDKSPERGERLSTSFTSVINQSLCATILVLWRYYPVSLGKELLLLVIADQVVMYCINVPA